jgi:hypothetical protein
VTVVVLVSGHILGEFACGKVRKRCSGLVYLNRVSEACGERDEMRRIGREETRLAP